MKRFLVSFMVIVAMELTVSCERTKPIPPTPEPPVSETEREPVVLMTRAINGDFEVQDCIGVYMSNFENGSSVPLKSSGNYVDNRKYTYTGSGWTAESPLYWKDENTNADFYAYYPYASVHDATELVVEVKNDQSALADYISSDFLWGKAENQSPNVGTVYIMLSHVMSQAVLKIKPGAGFTEEELIDANPQVQFYSLKNQAIFNIGTGELSDSDGAYSLTPYKVADLEYKAIVLPQTLEEAQLVEVKINNISYYLTRSMTFESGKQYTFTITIQKTSGDIEIGIGSWDVVDEDFGGVVS